MINVRAVEIGLRVAKADKRMEIGTAAVFFY